jgi:hypothetical protein
MKIANDYDKLRTYTFDLPPTAFHGTVRERSSADRGLLLWCVPENSKMCHEWIQSMRKDFKEVLRFGWNLGEERYHFFMIIAHFRTLLTIIREMEKEPLPSTSFRSSFPHKMFGFHFLAMNDADLLYTITETISSRKLNMAHLEAPSIQDNLAAFFGHLGVHTNQLPDLGALKEALGQCGFVSMTERFVMDFPSTTREFVRQAANKPLGPNSDHNRGGT